MLFFAEGSCEAELLGGENIQTQHLLTTARGSPGEFSDGDVCDECAGEVQVEQAGAAVHNILNHQVLFNISTEQRWWKQAAQCNCIIYSRQFKFLKKVFLINCSIKNTECEFDTTDYGKNICDV